MAFLVGTKKYRFDVYKGDVNSFHNSAHQKCEDLMKPKQSIVVAFHRQSDIEKQEYRVRLQGSIDAVRYLMHNALPFHGHDESKNSIYRGIFLETLKLIESQNENARKVMQKALKNCKLTSPDIQKDIVECFAKEILKSIFEEIGNDVFDLLVDESSDVSKKEQMAVVLRYVDRCGVVTERFVGVVHVKDTSSLTLKSVIDSLFVEHNVSLKQVRGQGYNGASNMCGEFNGLKALILRDNSLAYYIHCFTHQLQLVVMAVAKHHDRVGDFFDKIALVVTVVFASCKRKDMIRDAHKVRIERRLLMVKLKQEREKIKNFLS
ncbi:uncharacterized protein [Rutidosis leptorrhynchoides]|uniref:uncharacterized protein n=1 Tax=Rutidosis leptorrhynchoides TaxID=125765 RepID=UPI003A9A101D